ncbi:peptidoglycan-binding protein [Streptomyces sp. H27-H1]|uniref:peptidoglycan-binding protein n=1 Tax=Streptomyces sp. H27-H1 TaxID=2996461 RepID=UPI002270F66D|nr:peptidoglycan-binding protein [Streptomyces sp. H27-H1]MCY0931703.1 peptidoglycan-binding protein [Streptomyces sp. H27-H1]
MSAKHRKWVAAVAGGAALLAGAGVAASAVIKSPAQVAADAGPPPMDVLVARVEKRVLRDTVILRGTATATQTVQVTPTARAEGAAAPVVTKVAATAGSPVEAGRVLLEVSGRPVFVLPGRLPVYRDLKPGATGEDVKQLQQALAGRGHPAGGDKAGTFGAGTKTALTAFYRSIGYDAPPALADGGQAVEAAEEAVTGARRALEDVRAAGSAAGGSGGSGGAGGAGGSGGTKGAGSASGAKAASALAVRRAEEDLAKARRKLTEAQEVAGPMLPAGEVVFLEGFPARVTAVNTRVGSAATGPALTLSAGALVVRGQLQEHQKGLVRAGQRVEIKSEVSGVTATAEVASVADTAAAPPAQPQGGTGDGQQQAPPGAPGYAMVVEPDSPLDPALAGQDVRLTVEAAATSGDALVVPVSAVSAGADGRTSVSVVDSAGKRRQVEVQAGTTGDGYVEVRPAGAGELSEGDNVVTGINPGLAAGAGGKKQ